MPEPPGNGWNEWSRHVLAELGRLSDAAEKHTSALGNLRTEVAKLKLKSGAWGAIGAGSALILGLILWLIKGQVMP